MNAAREAALGVLRGWAAENGIAVEETGDARLLVVQLPGERKLTTTVSLRFGDHAVRLLAFIVRHPDEREADVHRWLLARNARLHTVAFLIDRLGDVYLAGECPLKAFTGEHCDRMLGEILLTADESFDELLALGFLTSIRREWEWRRARGESTANLQAFRHLLEGEARHGDGDSSN